MRHFKTLIPMLLVVLFASIALAASLSVQGTGPNVSSKGTTYVQTLPTINGSGRASSVSWSWDVTMPFCQEGTAYPTLRECPQPSGMIVKLCWWTSLDGSFWENAENCRDVSNQKSGSTTQWPWFFNLNDAVLNFRFVFRVPGSGSVNPVASGATNRVTVNY